MKVTSCLGYYAAIVLLFLSANNMDAERPTDEAQAAPIVKAWGILFQVMERFKEYVANKALSSIHNDDATSNLAISILLSENKRNPSAANDGAEEKLFAFTRAVAALHAAGDAFDQSGSETELAKVQSAFAEMQRWYSADVVEAARTLAHRFRCPMHPEVIGERNDLCPKCGMPLDTLARLSPFVLPAGAVPAKMINASVKTDEPLQVGMKAQAHLYLRTLRGVPVLPTDLREVHTQKIHLLIIDQSLSDYHHEHPQPGKAYGEYTFSFTPQKPGPYRIWADVQPYLTGIQEYAFAEMAAPTTGERLTDTAESLTATADGVRYKLSFDSPSIKSGEPASGKLQITRENGTPITDLEPVMGAFAHLVAFHSDGKTVLHIHPKGTRQLAPNDRGGPTLEFQFYSTKPGFFRLFSQTQVGGEQKFARFGLMVQP